MKKHDIGPVCSNSLLSGLIAVFVVCLGIIPLSAYGATIHVPSNMPTIQAGLDAASDGDTVLVAPGVFIENINYDSTAVALIGAGPALTTLSPSNPELPVILIPFVAGLGAQFSGFTVTGGGANSTMRIHISTQVEISGNIFHDNIPIGGNNIEVISVFRSSALISRNLFYSNGGIGCVGFRPGAEMSQIINNTFDNNERGFYSIASGGVAINNIVTNSLDGGIDALSASNFSRLDYNDVWNNGVNYNGLGPGPNDISLDPLYADIDTRDYRLDIASPVIDAGDPEPSFDDPDGTRNDMGAFPSFFLLPLAADINFGAEDETHVIDHSPTIFWNLLDTLGSQTQYELEVGSDRDWSVAEMWDSGPALSSDRSGVYGGLPLLDGVTYSLRLRVDVGAGFGDWRGKNFRMNSVPTAPLTIDPLGDKTVPFNSVILKVLNSSDPERDMLSYEFEVRADSLLAIPAIVQAGVPEQSDSTTSDFVRGLRANTRYFWRARTFDGFEKSAWSSAASFIARGPGLIRVPEDQPTIQAGITAAEAGDTVLAGPGIYVENIDYQNKSLILLGSGSDLTTIRPLNPSSETIIADGTSDSGAVFSGFTVTGGGSLNTFVINGATAFTVSNNVFHDNIPFGSGNVEVISISSSSVLITRNLFYANGGIGCVGLRFGAENSKIMNNTFDGNERGFFSIASGGVAINNIITNSRNGGINALDERDFSRLDYNDVWNNGVNYSRISPGPNDISADPKYVDPVTHDYSLALGSPAIDAGDPNPDSSDPDGSRNDMGAFSSMHCLLDSDGDEFSDCEDNCTFLANPEQVDSDSDGMGDVCDECTLVPGVCVPCCDHPGDADGNNFVNIADATFLVAMIFHGGASPECRDEGDADGSGRTNITDVLFIVTALFVGGNLPVCGSTGL